MMLWISGFLCGIGLIILFGFGLLKVAESDAEVKEFRRKQLRGEE